EEIFATESHLLLFVRNDANEMELWTSDGTASGTELVGLVPARDEDQVTAVVGNTLYFAGETDADGTELWKTDGTAAGTGVVKDIYPGAKDGFAGGLTFFGGRLILLQIARKGATNCGGPMARPKGRCQRLNTQKSSDWHR